MKRRARQTLWTAGPVILLVLIMTGGWAWAASPIKISLVADKTSYGPGEPIQMQVRVFNETAADVITHQGFLHQDFHLMITFTDPDGIPVKQRFGTAPEPGPPLRYNGHDAVPVEIIPPAGDPGSESLFALDANDYYNLANKYGWFTAQVFVALETFSSYVTDPVGVRLSYLDDPGRGAFNPVASNKIRFEIVPLEPVAKSAIHARVKLLRIGSGTRPPVTKMPLENAAIRLVRLSDVPDDYQPINFKTYPIIWSNVDAVSSTLTDSEGVAKFDRVPRDDYLLMAHYPQAKKFTHLGRRVEADNTLWSTGGPIVEDLRVIEKADGKKSPGKVHKRTGSELLITEPEFVEWDTSEELYPFVLETLGDWDVTTTVEPPEGFVADHEALNAEVINETESVQFIITDVGSKWEETAVTYEINHKGKKEKIKSKIGIKLSKKLAKKKGLSVYGDTPAPGPFKGGKKVKDKDMGKK